MQDTTDLSSQPLTFDAESSKRSHLGSSAFRGRVPVVLTFVGQHGDGADAAIVALDRSLIRFGERRVQLLVVVDADPSDVATRLAVNVPLICDEGLAEELSAQVDDQGRHSSVILGNDGRVLDVVRQLPTDDPAAAVLIAIDLLTSQFPDRFTTAPGTDDNVETIDDPTRVRAIDESPSFRQRVAWITGDRAKEAEALADTVGGDGADDASVLAAAAEAVSNAHGDSSVTERDPVTSDVATRNDVIEKL